MRRSIGNDSPKEDVNLSRQKLYEFKSRSDKLTITLPPYGYYEYINSVFSDVSDMQSLKLFTISCFVSVRKRDENKSSS